MLCTESLEQHSGKTTSYITCLLSIMYKGKKLRWIFKVIFFEMGILQIGQYYSILSPYQTTLGTIFF